MQLDAFEDQRETDEELANHGPPGIDLSSHVDVFYAILGQVSDYRHYYTSPRPPVFLTSLLFSWPCPCAKDFDIQIIFTLKS